MPPSRPTRPNRPHRLLLLAIALLGLGYGPAALAAGNPVCDYCGKHISGSYVKSDGNTYCNRTCYEHTLPLCDVCKKRIKGRYMTSGDKRFCSTACYTSTLPKCELCKAPITSGAEIGGHTYCAEHAKAERCASCSLPFINGYGISDGRNVCKTCYTTAIVDPDDARKVYLAAQADVAAVTGLKSKTLPTMKLVGLDLLGEMMERTTHVKLGPNMVQQGLYVRDEEITTTDNGWTVETESKVDETIYLLIALQPDRLRATAAHELTHDLIAEEFPRLEGCPLWLEEGACQYVAALVCRRNKDLATLTNIRNATDTVYGDGYRYLVKQCGEFNWPKLKRYLETVDIKRLPATP